MKLRYEDVELAVISVFAAVSMVVILLLPSCVTQDSVETILDGAGDLAEYLPKATPTPVPTPTPLPGPTRIPSAEEYMANVRAMARTVANLMNVPVIENSRGVFIDLNGQEERFAEGHALWIERTGSNKSYPVAMNGNDGRYYE